MIVSQWFPRMGLEKNAFRNVYWYFSSNPRLWHFHLTSFILILNNSFPRATNQNNASIIFIWFIPWYTLTNKIRIRTSASHRHSQEIPRGLPEMIFENLNIPWEQEKEKNRKQKWQIRCDMFSTQNVISSKLQITHYICCGPRGWLCAGSRGTAIFNIQEQD